MKNKISEFYLEDIAAFLGEDGYQMDATRKILHRAVQNGKIVYRVKKFKKVYKKIEGDKYNVDRI